MKSSRLEGLDALRGIAAAMVLLFHVEGIYGAQMGMARQYLSVAFFFMLSGFVMARTYETKFADGLTPAGFLAKRFARFFPIMACGTAIGLFASWGQLAPEVALVVVVLGIVMIPIPGPLPFPLNNPTWSIFAELVGNLTHAAILGRVRVPTLIAFSATGGTALLCFHGSFRGYPWFGIAQIAAAYPLGIAIWRINGDAAKLPWWLGCALLIGWPCLSALASFGPWADFAFVYLVCPVILLAGLSRTDLPGTALGMLSFPLYAVHEPVLELGRALGWQAVVTVFLALTLSALILLLPLGLRRLSSPDARQFWIR